MREIKFRAWDKKNKEMYYIGQEFDDEYGCIPYLEIFKNGEWFFEWGDASDKFDLDNKIGILMQYTGLKDKNGKEIYEGDIILATIIENLLPSGENSEYVDKRVVEWNKEQGGFAFAEDEYEIIGNIYENKDLLTK